MATYEEKIEHQLLMNAQQLAHRLEIGDDVEAPREVEHFATFGSRGKAKMAVEEFKRLGYSAEVTRQRLFRADVTMTTTSTVDGETADAFTIEVMRVVTGYGGVYDGWGAEVIDLGS